MKDYSGTPVAPEQAWGMFDAWKAAGKEIGVLFFGASGTVTTVATITAAKYGRLHLHGGSTALSFNLKSAEFNYGPTPIFPRWPAGPAIEVTAVQAKLANGDWVAFAEGFAAAQAGLLQSGKE